MEKKHGAKEEEKGENLSRMVVDVKGVMFCERGCI